MVELIETPFPLKELLLNLDPRTILIITDLKEDLWIADAARPDELVIMDGEKEKIAIENIIDTIHPDNTSLHRIYYTYDWESVLHTYKSIINVYK